MLPHEIASLHLDTVNAGERSGAPVLCLPGMFSGSWAFERLLPLLAARGHSAASLSYRGRPPNAPVPDVGALSIADYAHDAGLAARALGRPIVIGHSLGGLLALMLAGQNLVRAAVLVSSAPPRGIPIVSAPLLLRMTAYLPALLLSRPFLPGTRDLDAMVLNCVPEHRRPALRARFTADSGRIGRQITLGVFKVPASTIRVPLLVVSGDDDRFIPLGVARKIARKYAAPLHVATGHGHFLFEEPGWEATAGVILDWIGKLPTPTS
jgi:pimeloyl-ACP methyl ester carboxylesterase